MVYGLAAGALVYEDGRLYPGERLRVQKNLATAEMTDTFKRALFVGRWFSRAGDTATIYSLWGVKP